ncbi:hypothetical protein [Paenibacillus polymyxa]|uniref:hypothetical protein n=1 Tax=Paenibacillus polymyxa TaxID=1406 RepID=UPI0032AE86BE
MRVGFDLTIAVATRFFSIIFLRRKSGGKGERSASPDSNLSLRTARHKDEFSLERKWIGKDASLAFSPFYGIARLKDVNTNFIAFTSFS